MNTDSTYKIVLRNLVHTEDTVESCTSPGVFHILLSWCRLAMLPLFSGRSCRITRNAIQDLLRLASLIAWCMFLSDSTSIQVLLVRYLDGPYKFAVDF